MRKSKIAKFAAGCFFYCRATDEDGRPLALDLSTANGAVFIGWSGPLTGPFLTVNWMARITSCRLVAKETVALETGMVPSSDAVHYVLFKFADVSNFIPRDVSNLVLASNTSGEGGKFRTFQSNLSEVFHQKIAISTEA